MSPRWRRDASKNAIEFVERNVEVLVGSWKHLRHRRMRAELACCCGAAFTVPGKIFDLKI
jgi:hypothetical protein